MLVEKSSMYHVNLVQELKANNPEPINWHNKVLLPKSTRGRQEGLSDRVVLQEGWAST
jgi:hypothetical protein